MKRIIAVFVFSFVAFPAVSTAAEPAWWTQQKRQCGLSPSLAYNSWDGKCNSGGSSGGGSAGATIGGELGNLIGKEIGKELNKALWGDPEAAARRRAEEELRTQEQRRASEEARLRAAEAEAARRRAEQEVLRKHEEMKNRLLGGMMGVEGSASLGLMGVESHPSKLSLMTDSDSPLKVTETRGAFGSTEVTPAGIGSPPAKQGLQLMLDGEATRSSKQARQGFDTDGKIMGSDLPAPPPTPTGKPVDQPQMDKIRDDYHHAADEHAKADLRRQQLEEEKKLAERIRKEAEKKYQEQQRQAALVPENQPAKQEEDDKLAQAQKLLDEATSLDNNAGKNLDQAKRDVEETKRELGKREKARDQAEKNLPQANVGQPK